LRSGAFAPRGANKPQKIFFLILDKGSKNVRWNRKGEAVSHISDQQKDMELRKNFEIPTQTPFPAWVMWSHSPSRISAPAEGHGGEEKIQKNFLRQGIN
jgi:hypothetical protein